MRLITERRGSSKVGWALEPARMPGSKSQCCRSPHVSWVTLGKSSHLTSLGLCLPICEIRDNKTITIPILQGCCRSNRINTRKVLRTISGTEGKYLINRRCFLERVLTGNCGRGGGTLQTDL